MNTKTSTRLINVTTWGREGIGDFRVRVPADCQSHEALDLIQASIERRTGMILATFQGQGTSVENGLPASQHYQGTLATKCKGGFSPVGDIWVGVPVR